MIGCNVENYSDLQELEIQVNNALEVARVQSINMALSLKDEPELLPKTLTPEGQLETCRSDWWVSGFFPGVLWYIYENTGDPELKSWAREYTRRVEDQKHTTDHHDTVTGKPEVKHTAQGYNHESTWARGQGWGLYGFTMMYRKTGNSLYLDQAAGMADFIIDHPNLPEDKIPYWDFDAPNIPNELRDASAAAIICSALLELSRYVDDERAEIYLDVARTQIRTLSSPPYLAEKGANGNFILKHGVGHMPNGTEIDVPLTYADYYFVEALMRYKQWYL